MGEKTRKISRVAAAILIFSNVLFMIFCCLLFAISLWIICSPDTLSVYIQAFGSPVIKVIVSSESTLESFTDNGILNSTWIPDIDDRTNNGNVLFPKEFLDVQLGIALFLLAIFFFFIAFMGLYGAITCSHFLLFMYSILVILLLLLESALIFYYTSNIMEKGIQVEDGQITHALRLAFHCCDQNYTAEERVQPPWSCCGVNGYPSNCTAQISYTKNCQETITTWLQKYQAIIYTSVAVLHVILSSCSLLRRAYSSSFSHT